MFKTKPKYNYDYNSARRTHHISRSCLCNYIAPYNANIYSCLMLHLSSYTMYGAFLFYIFFLLSTFPPFIILLISFLRSYVNYQCSPHYPIQEDCPFSFADWAFYTPRLMLSTSLYSWRWWITNGGKKIHKRNLLSLLLCWVITWSSSSLLAGHSK